MSNRDNGGPAFPTPQGETMVIEIMIGGPACINEIDISSFSLMLDHPVYICPHECAVVSFFNDKTHSLSIMTKNHYELRKVKP